MAAGVELHVPAPFADSPVLEDMAIDSIVLCSTRLPINGGGGDVSAAGQGLNNVQPQLLSEKPLTCCTDVSTAAVDVSAAGQGLNKNGKHGASLPQATPVPVCFLTLIEFQV